MARRVRHASDGQRNEERGCPEIDPVAGAGRQRRKHDGGEPAQPALWRERHVSLPLCPGCATARPHSTSHSAVRGALAGASCNSAASRLRSAATSMS